MVAISVGQQNWYNTAVKSLAVVQYLHDQLAFPSHAKADALLLRHCPSLSVQLGRHDEHKFSGIGDVLRHPSRPASFRNDDVLIELAGDAVTTQPVRKFEHTLLVFAR